VKFNYSPPPGVETKNQWSYTSTLPICLHGVDKGFTFVTHAYDKRPIRIRVREKKRSECETHKTGREWRKLRDDGLCNLHLSVTLRILTTVVMEAYTNTNVSLTTVIQPKVSDILYKNAVLSVYIPQTHYFRKYSTFSPMPVTYC
jgi:hypothetical protein